MDEEECQGVIPAFDPQQLCINRLRQIGPVK